MRIQQTLLLFTIIITVYLLATGVDVMDFDASQYASMSREMAVSKSYLQVYEQGQDYLDKPPFLFWINSLSMTLLGENNLAYKLPSILFALLAAWALYRFAKLYYNTTIALMASVVLATSQAVFLITNDVRTDTILMGWVILAIWQLTEWFRHPDKTVHFVIGFVAIGFGMLTKGLIALMVPIFALGCHFVLQRKFSVFFKPVYLIGLCIIAVILLPMSIGLYQQFDLHPEKIVNGHTHISGLRFFYWTQSFGRITGESVWNNNVSFAFLFHNLMWGLLPWSAFFVAGLIKDSFQLIKNRCRVVDDKEFISTGGFILTYCSLAVSNYQLPHYIYVVLPLVALITAKMIYSLFWENKWSTLKLILTALQWLVWAALLLLPFLVLLFTFPTTSWWVWAIPVATALATIYTYIASDKKVWHTSIVAIIGVNIFLSSWFYPQLLTFQPGCAAGRFVAQESPRPLYLYKASHMGAAVYFYSRQIIPSADSLSQVKPKAFLITAKKGLEDLAHQHQSYRIIKELPSYPITRLTLDFLNKKTRDQVVEKCWIIELL